MPLSRAMRAMRSGIAFLRRPAGADLEGHRDRDRRHHRRQDAPHQGLVAQQGGARRHLADLLGRAAHVDVDDVGAEVEVEARRLGHGRGVGPDDLHRDGPGLAAVVEAPAGLAGAPQAGVGGDHLRDGEPRPQAPAELTERPVPHPGHGGEDQAVSRAGSGRCAWPGCAQCVRAGGRGSLWAWCLGASGDVQAGAGRPGRVSDLAPGQGTQRPRYCAGLEAPHRRAGCRARRRAPVPAPGRAAAARRG